MNKFSRRALHHQLALAGLLGVSTLVLQTQAYAANYGSLNSSSITLSDGDVVTADTLFNSFLTGIYNKSDETASIDLKSGSKVIANGNGSAARGIELEGANSTLHASGLIIDVKGSTAASGLYVSGSKDRVELGTGGSITVEGTNVSGLYVSSASSVNADHIVINTKGSGIAVDVEKQGSSVNLGSGSSITTSDGTAIMVFGANGNVVDGVAKFTATRLTVDTQGHAAYGVNVQKNSKADFGSGSSVTTHGTDSAGALVYGEFEAKDGLKITTTGTGVDSTALEVRTGGKATVGANSHLRAEQAGALVAREAGSTIDFKGSATARNTIFSGGSYGASSQNNGIVNLENTDITVDRNGSYAIWAAGGVINAKNTTVTGANGVYGVVATNSSAYFTGDTAVTMTSAGQIAMISSGVGHLISGVGKMNITGGVYAQENATTDLQMTQGSVLTGGAFASSGGKTNLSFDGSKWNMSEDSVVSKLVLNNSTVDFTEDKTGSILSVGDLSGNGTFIMRINMVGDSADKLVVTGTSAGNHNVRVLNRGSLATTGNEVITIVETQDGMASFDLLNTSRVVELGGYQYSLRKNSTNWELFASGEVVPPVDPNPVDPAPVPVDPSEPKISSTSDASANFLNVGYMLNYAETQTLLQRMGELRQSESSQGDVWVRAFTGKFDSFAGGKLSGFDMDYTGAQIGADRRLNIADADVYLGVMGGTTKADSNYKEGDGDVKGYHFGVYGTYVTPNNFYVDGTLKYSHLKTSFNVADSQYDRITGSASSDGYGLSVEVGKRFYFNEAKAGYYIEPQAQLSYLHQDSGSTKMASNGLVVDLDSYDSTLARASAIIGYEVKEGRNPVNVYVKTGYVTEMSGDAGYRLNGNPEKHDFGGGWWENGVGVTASINKKHNLYLDGTYATGSKFDQMQVNAGYRYSF